MHRQQSTRTLKSLKLGAVHYLFNVCLTLVTTVMFVAWFILNDQMLLRWSGAAFVFLLLSGLVFFLKNMSWQCPLCMGKLWVRSGCRRHRNAKPLLGISYRTGVAISILFSKSYRCLYCGEAFSTRKARR